MTKAEAISRFLQIAASEVGYHEGENNYNKFAAQLDPLNITYGAKQNQPWCGEFVLWCAVKAFGVDAGLKFLRSPNPSGVPLCSAGAGYFRQAAAFGKEPQRGDIIFFYYDGGINHTGIVESVRNGAVTTIEGNSGDAVARRIYQATAPNIAGYGRPNWVAVCDCDNIPPADEQNKRKQIDGLPMLKSGDANETVRAAQFVLIGRKFSCGSWGADGDFGGATETAVRNFQTENGLEIDGVIGPETWSKLLGVS